MNIACVYFLSRFIPFETQVRHYVRKKTHYRTPQLLRC